MIKSHTERTSSEKCFCFHAVRQSSW